MFLGLPMSTPTTGAAQRARLGQLDLRLVTLPRLRDLDTAEDADAIVRDAPDTRTAGAYGRLLASAR